MQQPSLCTANLESDALRWHHQHGTTIEAIEVVATMLRASPAKAARSVKPLG